MMQQLLYHAQFTKQFMFRTPVPAYLCVERLGELPFLDGKHEYIIEYEPVGDDFQFWIRLGNKYQFTPQKARCIGTGWITQQNNETVVKGEVQVGRNRMLQIGIMVVIGVLFLLGLWSSLDLLIFFTIIGGMLLVTSLFSFVKSIWERNIMFYDIKTQITPYLSDRRERLSEQETRTNQETDYDASQQSRRRRQ